MIQTAENNAEEIGLAGVIKFKQMSVYDFVVKKEAGCVIANPPYGERLGEKKEVENMYKYLGAALKNQKILVAVYIRLLIKCLNIYMVRRQLREESYSMVPLSVPITNIGAKS